MVRLMVPSTWVPGPDQEHRGREFAHREDEDVDPGRQQHRQQQRQENAQENLPDARAGDLGHLFQLAMDLGEPADDEAHAVGQVHGDVGDQQDPDRVVDRNRQHQIGEQHAGADDDVRDRDRREGERIEHPAGARHRAQRDPGHHEGEHDHEVAAMVASSTLVFTASTKIG